MAQVNTIVVVSGKIGSGKDTIADHLINKYGFFKYGFADSLKKLTAMLFEVDVGDHVGQSLTLDDREILQKTGTFGRSIDKDCWVRLLLQRLDESHCNRVVIKDARFPNEIEALEAYCKERDIQFFTIRINNISTLKDFRRLKLGKTFDRIKKYPSYLSPHYHESEISLDNWSRWDLEIERDCDSTIQDTFREVDDLMKGKLYV
ncbi:MAG: hypothetical protein CMB80_05870 [Flammeovirgaceae bacterium]|nr:hypothetical protein [Flammeovirgaceae bacterium]|tara:strand:- start:1590 stop:2201 length:612 start_codon:yes stop_codon:yes gene_type:complete